MMTRQVWALIALKWLLLRRTWGAGRSAFAALSLFLGLAGLAVSALLAAGLYVLGGRMGEIAEAPAAALAVLDGLVFLYVFFWMWGLLMEVQRSDIIDMRRLLHLPVSPAAAHGLNFAASLAGPLLFLSLLPGLGLVAGMARAFGPSMALPGVALGLLFLLMLGAWAHYARGVVAVLMENRRRRRLVMTLIPVCFVALGQVPGLLGQALRTMDDGGGGLAGAAVTGLAAGAHLLLPPAWFSYGLWALGMGEYWTAAGAAALMLCGTVWGLMLGYRATLRYYTGAGAAAGAPKAAPKGPFRPPATLRRLPLVSDDTAGLGWAFFLAYFRHPSIRFQLVAPLGFALFVLFMYRSGAYGERLGNERVWLPVAVIVWPFMNFGLFLTNLFGGDGGGFRGLMLLPVPRHRILAAKHLALFPFAAGMAAVFVLIGAAAAGSTPYLTGLSLLHVLYLYLLICAAGVWSSVYFPYHMGRNALRGHGGRAATMLAGFASVLLISALLAPTGWCLGTAAAGGGGTLPPGLAPTLLLLAGAAGVYRLSLRHGGDALRERETKVLAAILRDTAE